MHVDAGIGVYELDSPESGHTILIPQLQPADWDGMIIVLVNSIIDDNFSILFIPVAANISSGSA